MSNSLQQLLGILCSQEPLSFTIDLLGQAIEQSIDVASGEEIAALLVALRITHADRNAEVISKCAQILKSRALIIPVTNALDIVGTGGDGKNTFNVSTASAIVAAGAGCKVAKHGNRASSSTSGSSDILVSLGCSMTIPPTNVPEILDKSNFVFLDARQYHPALAKFAPIRAKLKIPTIFNILGPLINPVQSSGGQILGVHSEYLGETYAKALQLNGAEHAMVVWGEEGLDEISPAGRTTVWRVSKTEIKRQSLHPSDFGLQSHPLSDVSSGTPAENSAILMNILRGNTTRGDPITDYILLNCGALLHVANKAKDWKEGVALAEKSITSGGALKALTDFIANGQAFKSS